MNISHDPTQRRFVLVEGGSEAVLAYVVVDPLTVDFQHTFVPDGLRGRKVGTRLVLYALDWARAEGYRVMPSCWFVSAVAARHPEYAKLLVA